MEKSSNKRLTINIVANCIAFAVNFIISFFLTPYIVENVGKETYGFLALGNNFVNYVSLITIALNSMASRFITIRIQRKEFDSASKYFSSVLLSNILICLVIAIPLALVIIFMQNIVDIENENIADIKTLWAFLFINIGIDLMSSVFAISAFAKNRIDLTAKANIIASISKVVVVILCYTFFKPYVFYIGIATVIYSIVTLILNIRYYKKLTPEVKIEKKLFRKSCIKELVSAGIWNTVSRVGGIALTELDLLLSNLLINASAMGTLSLVKTIPSYMTSLTATITNAFMPNLTITYAKYKENKEIMLEKIRNSIKILIFFHSIMYGILIAYSDKFYMLWLGEEVAGDIQFMYILGIITVGGCFISAVSSVMLNIFTIFNKLKLSSISVVVTGIISFVITYLAVKYTSLGLIAIAGVSVALVIIRNIIILMPYAAKCVGIPWYTFYKDMLLNIFVVLYSVVIALFVKNILDINSWIMLIVASGIASILIAIINYFILLNKTERKEILEKIRRKIK